jgi:hypothetical protein
MRFGDLDLLEREASYGRSGFAMQFMLDPSYSDQDKYPLKLADLMVLDLDPQGPPVKVGLGLEPRAGAQDLPRGHCRGPPVPPHVDREGELRPLHGRASWPSTRAAVVVTSWATPSWPCSTATSTCCAARASRAATRTRT